MKGDKAASAGELWSGKGGFRGAHVYAKKHDPPAFFGKAHNGIKVHPYGMYNAHTSTSSHQSGIAMSLSAQSPS